MSVNAPGKSGILNLAKRLGAAAAKPAEAKPQEPKPDAPAPQADAAAGADKAQPKANTPDAPVRARPRASSALANAKTGAKAAQKPEGQDKPKDADAKDADSKDAGAKEDKPSVVGAIDKFIAKREGEGADMSDRRKRLEEAQHQGDLQIALALKDAADGKAEKPGYEREDADRAIKDGGLTPIEHYDATGRAIIAEQLDEEAARAKEAEAELLKGRTAQPAAGDDPAHPKVNLDGMSAEERALLYQTTTTEQALLNREADVLKGGTTGEATDLTKVDIDEDGKGGDIEGLDNTARDARIDQIAKENERLDHLNDQIAASFTDQELEQIASGPSIVVNGGDGEEGAAWAVDPDLAKNLAERRAAVAETRPELVPDHAVADAPDPAGAVDAPAPVDPAATAQPAAPAPPTDDELLDQAAAAGAIDANARDRFAFNEAGELTYAAQPGDGYWQAAEHVAPPAGQSFQEHWMNTWSENSTRTTGTPDNPMVSVDQPIVIPGYTRDQLAAAFAPPAQEEQPAPSAPDPATVPVSGERSGDTTTLDVNGTKVQVSEQDFRNGKCLVDGTNVDEVSVSVPGAGGGFDATVERRQSPDGSSVTYGVTATAPAPAAAPAPAPDAAPQGDSPAAPASGGDQQPASAPAADAQRVPATQGDQVAGVDLDGDGYVATAASGAPGINPTAPAATSATEEQAYDSIVRFEVALDPASSTTSYGDQAPQAVQDYEFATWLYMQGRYADALQTADRWVAPQP